MCAKDFHRVDCVCGQNCGQVRTVLMEISRAFVDSYPHFIEALHRISTTSGCCRSEKRLFRDEFGLIDKSVE